MEEISENNMESENPLLDLELRKRFDEPTDPAKGLTFKSIGRETNMEAKLFPKLTRASGLRLLTSMNVAPPSNATLDNVKITLVAALRLRFENGTDWELDEALAPIRRKVYQRDWLRAQATFYGGYRRPRDTATAVELRYFLERLYVMEGLEVPPPEVMRLEDEAVSQHTLAPSARDMETERLRFEEQLSIGKTAAYLAQHFPRLFIPMWGQQATEQMKVKKRKVDDVLAFGVYRKADLEPIIKAAASAGLLLNYMEGQKGAWVVHLSKDATMLERAVDDSRRALARRSGSILRAQERMLLSEEEAQQRRLDQGRKEALRLNKAARGIAVNKMGCPSWNVRGQWDIRSEAASEGWASENGHKMVLMSTNMLFDFVMVGTFELSGLKGYMLFERKYVGEDNSTISFRWMCDQGCENPTGGKIEDGRLTFSEEGSKVDGWLGDSERGDIDLEGWLSGCERDLEDRFSISALDGDRHLDLYRHLNAILYSQK